MKKTRTILCILLALVMVFTLFACNKSETPGGDVNAAPGNSESSSGNDSGGGGNDSGSNSGSNSGGNAGGGQTSDSKEYVSITIGVDSYLGRFLAGLSPSESETGCDGVYDTIFRIDPVTRKGFSIVLKDYYWEDDTTFIMEMRDDVYFSNGDNATAEDLIFSYFNHLERGSNYLNSFNLVWDECIVRDKYTAQFKFEKIFPEFDTIPFHLLDKAWALEIGWDSMDWYEPVGSGPYYVDEYVADSYMVLKSRGDDYWYKDEGPIYVDEFVIKYFPDAATLYMALEVGEIDLAANIAASDYSRFVSSGGNGFDALTVSTGGVYYFIFSFTDTDAFQDIRVREALAIGVKWDEIGQISRGDFYIPTYSAASSLCADYIKTSDLPGTYEYNPDRAKELLAEAGYGPGNPLKITTMTMDREIYRNAFEAFDFYASQIGLECTIDYGDVNAALSVWLQEGGTDVGFWYNFSGSASGSMTATISEANDPGGVSFNYVPFPEFLEMFDRMAYSADPAVRSQATKDIQQYMYDNYIYIPTSEMAVAYGWRTDRLSKDQIERYVELSNYVHISRLGLQSAWN